MRASRTILRFCLNVLGILSVTCLLAGCATAFHREWKAAIVQPVPVDDITGPWQGAWASEVSGHHGALRCVAARQSPGQYRFHYYATYKTILHGAYTITQNVERVDRTFKMHGSAEL